jgi:MFS family permease
MESTSLSKNPFKIYCFGFFYMYLIIVPVIVPYFLSLGLSMEEVFIVQAFFGFTVAIFEVPSAYLGDLWGRKRVLVLGTFISAIGFSFLLIAHDFYSLLFYEMLLGVGASFVSGAELSILYDSIGDKAQDKLKSMSHLQMLLLIGESFAAVTCCFLMLYSYEYVIYGQVFIAWAPLLIALTVVEPPIERMSKDSHSENIKEVFRYIFLDDQLLRLIFINITLWSLSTFYAVWIIQKYWQVESVPLYGIALLWAVCNLIAAVSSKAVPYFEVKFGAGKLIIVMGILPIVAYISMGLATGLLSIGVSGLFYISRGINTVLLREAFNARIKSKFRNTANSILSLFFRLGFFITGPAIGYMIDAISMRAALLAIGGFYICIFIFVLVPLVNKK